MGVAPDTDEMLNSIPPRTNGGNLDDPNMVAGTAIESPMRKGHDLDTRDGDDRRAIAQCPRINCPLPEWKGPLAT